MTPKPRLPTRESMMAAWPEIRTHMRSAYRLLRDEPNVIALVWDYEDGRSQKIIVRRYTSEEREMVEFKSPFARHGMVDPEAMLRENTRLPFGSIALSRDVYILIENAMLEPLSISDFEFLIGRIASIADHLEGTHGGADAF